MIYILEPIGNIFLFKRISKKHVTLLLKITPTYYNIWKVITYTTAVNDKSTKKCRTNIEWYKTVSRIHLQSPPLSNSVLF